MNYGKKNAGKKRKQFLSRRLALRKRFAVLALVGVLVIVLAGAAFVGNKGFDYAKGIIDNAPEIDALDATPTGYMSTVLDADGNVTAELVQSGSNRVYVTLDEVPEQLQQAFVAIEDERFYEHNGIDLKGIVRAGMRGVANGFHFHEGASTITQQLLKNNVFDGWTEEKNDTERMTRKLQEQFLAIQLEKKVSKDWIMENYLNTINLGQNTLGVQAAAKRYFGKDVSDLTLPECAVIAGITKNPVGYNPISYPEENKKRQLQVLDNMERLGYITKEEHDEAAEEDVYEKIGAVNENVQESEANITTYFVDALTEAVVRDLQEELGYSEAEAYKALYSGGLTIYSTQDPDIQEICDQVVSDDDNYDCRKKVSFSYALSIQQSDGSVEHFSEQSMLAYLRENTDRTSINYDSKADAKAAVKKYKKHLLEQGGKVIGENITYTVQPQTSVTVIDQKTGKVKALVGGRGKKEASRTLNRASNVTRQPGSTFKILTAYATALDQEEITLATAVKDEPIEYSSGKSVRNASRSYSGLVTIREAIRRSINTVAVKTIMQVTPQAGYDMAKKFGISTLTEGDVVEALPLGGIERGVTNLELTAAYAAIANEGVYKKPILYTKILDHNGDVLLENKSEKHRVIQKTTAFLLTSAMEDVVNSGTGTAANFSGMSIAGKTGTAGSNEATRDLWFAGFTPYYTCAVWGGYDDYSELNATLYPKIIWRKIMQEIHEGKSDPGFSKPDGITRYSVCTVSGLLAVKGVCPATHSEYFASGTRPSKSCDQHELAVICKKSGLLAGKYCPEKMKEEKAFVKESGNKEDRLPDKVCDVHTKEALEKKKKEEEQKKQQEEEQNQNPNPSPDESDTVTGDVTPDPVTE